MNDMCRGDRRPPPLSRPDRPLLSVAPPTDPRFLPTPELPKDPRVRRTRQALKAALGQLMDERDYDGISLSDVARAAGVARQTIYDHYDNKDALFQEILLDRIRQVYSKENIPKMVHHLRTGEPLQGASLFALVDQHQGVFRTAIDRFYGTFTAVYESVLIDVMASESVPDSQLATDASFRQATAAFVGGGVLALLRLHLEGHFDSRAQAEAFAAQVSRGVVAALSIDLDAYQARNPANG